MDYFLHGEGSILMFNLNVSHSIRGSYGLFFTWGGFNLNVSHSIRGSYGLFFYMGSYG